MTDKDTLAKLAQDMRAFIGNRSPDAYSEEIADLVALVSRLDALAAQQVPESAWRAAIEEWARARCVSSAAVNSIARRALELSSGSGEDK